MKRVGALLVLLAGCRLGGGPTIGFRGGHVTGGWQLNTGAADIGGGDNFGFGTEVGQSWRDGRAWTYGALTLDGFGIESLRNTGDVGRYDGGGLEGGLVGGEGHYHGFSGFNLFLGSAQGNHCDAEYLTTLSFGVRFFGKSPELYVAPRLEVYSAECFSID